MDVFNVRTQLRSDKNKYGKACSDKGSNKRSERESEMVGRAFNSGKRVSAYVCT